MNKKANIPGWLVTAIIVLLLYLLVLIWVGKVQMPFIDTIKKTTEGAEDVSKDVKDLAPKGYFRTGNVVLDLKLLMNHFDLS